VASRLKSISHNAEFPIMPNARSELEVCWVGRACNSA
jgi:hypothetical protein